MADLTRDRVDRAFHVALDRLLSAMHPDGFWEGRLSSSALSTATAVSALVIADREVDAEAIAAGAAWLCATRNADGGWGDTTDSPSNLATTLLVLSALMLADGEARYPEAVRAARQYIVRQAGDEPAAWAAAISQKYGVDRTFAVPILINCALAGLVPWESIPSLPFEMAAFPHRFYSALRLHVVSYALPALIAIGLLLHHRHPPTNPLLRAIRHAVTPAVLRKLARIQPDSGGFLEATPLTSFVAMSLVPIYGPEHPVARKCLAFIRRSMREDGSWPIDTDLATWVTTCAVAGLAHAGRLEEIDGETTRRWIAARQYRTVHPYTNAAAGGWGWTHWTGSVPDGDDTSGALLALQALGERSAMPGGVRWLLQLQNADGGWPTFCRGWGKLPFDKSCPDLTAHAIRALLACDPQGANRQIRLAIARGVAYLHQVQREDGAWIPLWFGNQLTQQQSNPVLGTARVLLAGTAPGMSADVVARGVRYLCSAQHPDGGWGGDAGIAASIEETALAVTALLAVRRQADAPETIARGLAYLVRRVEDGTWETPAPIGLYFASLWYAEELYPVVWTVDALGRALADGTLFTATDEAPSRLSETHAG